MEIFPRYQATRELPIQNDWQNLLIFSTDCVAGLNHASKALFMASIVDNVASTVFPVYSGYGSFGHVVGCGIIRVLSKWSFNVLERKSSVLIDRLVEFEIERKR